MILIDANILLYAEDIRSPQNESARRWLDEKLSGSEPVCFCWEVLTAYIRISTNKQVFRRPLTLTEARQRVQSWLDQPCVRVIQPTEQHWGIFQEMLTSGQAVANLAMDAHLAALAVEHGCVFYSTDSDFARFPKLKWKNPL